MTPSKDVVELVVLADEPALLFSSIAAAEGYLEAIDVDNGEYPIAYGPTGQVYYLVSENERVFVRPADTPPQPQRLKQVLIEALSKRGELIEGDLSLPDVIRLCARYVDDW